MSFNNSLTVIEEDEGEEEAAQNCITVPIWTTPTTTCRKAPSPCRKRKMMLTITEETECDDQEDEEKSKYSVDATPLKYRLIDRSDDNKLGSNVEDSDEPTSSTVRLASRKIPSHHSPAEFSVFASLKSSESPIKKEWASPKKPSPSRNSLKELKRGSSRYASAQNEGDKVFAFSRKHDPALQVSRVLDNMSFTENDELDSETDVSKSNISTP